jgi:hypothetical protein
MWPLLPIQDRQIQVIIQPDAIICGLIQSSKKYPCVLTAFEKISCTSSTFCSRAQAIKQFVVHHKLTHAFLSIALEPPFIIEQLIPLSKASASREELSNPTLKKLIWDYRYLHGMDNGNHLFYACGIPTHTLVGMQIISKKAGLNLITVTSTRTTLIHAYKALFGPAFRLAQLAVDLQRTNYALHTSISNDSVSRLLHIQPSCIVDRVQEKQSLLGMVGLNIMYKDIL